jgi:hypothetical protein
VQFLTPIDYQSKPVRNLVARLSLPLTNLAFACGTDGFFLIEEILAAAFPDFGEKLMSSLASLRAEIDLLTSLNT